MYRHLRRATAVVAIVAATSLGGAAAASAETLNNAEALPSCLDHQWVGNSGVINVRTSPSRTIAWNVVDNVDNGGQWTALVYVDDRLVDKKVQNYNPHGSVSPLDSRSGSVFRLDITHVDTKGKSSHSVPNGCIVP
jgi:hypothetical protein